ncbi:MAG: phosphotransferase [Deltaproteobacteria bacterium]|jgi:Ser/Thr protein kinase RdoA (MazF antagonist)|nr:phosphotransferase [Deltaproteobacteria bacterium]
MKETEWGFTKADEEALFLLEESYDITPRGLETILSGRINLTFLVECQDGSKLIFQRINPIFQASPALGDNWVKVSSALEKNGLQAPRLIANKRGENLTFRGGTVWRLTTYMEGTAPEPGIGAAYLAGKALGSAHRALNIPLPIQLIPLPKGVEYTNQRLPVQADFTLFSNLYRLHPQLPLLEETLKRAALCALRLPGSPAYQRVFLIRDLVIHGDPKRDNYLSKGDHFVLIDWDTVCYGDPLIDLAEALRSFASRKERPFFDADLAESLLRGYREKGLQMDRAHFRLLASVVRGVSLNLARRYLTDALVDSFFAWEKTYASHFDQCLARAHSLLDLVEELYERDFELWDL